MEAQFTEMRLSYSLYSLIFSLHFVHVRNFYVDRNAHLGECVEYSLRDFSAFRQNDQHFVEPLTADILSCICKVRYHRYAVDFVSGSVLVYENNASRTNADSG